MGVSQLNYAVGDEVLVSSDLDRGRGPSPAVITRIGRTNVYITRHGREVAFDGLTGVEKRGRNAPGIGDRIYTREQWAETRRKAELMAQLRKAGVKFDWSFSQHQRIHSGVLVELLSVLVKHGLVDLVVTD